MRPRTTLATLTSRSLLLLAPLFGCAELEEDASVHEAAVATNNGLAVINGLQAGNGLNAGNGLSIINGLSTINGLQAGNGLMTTAGGRTTVSYLVKCALPAGQAIVKKDQYGTSYTFMGSLGLAPAWKDGACDTQCQEYVSACMMAHINTAGVHVPLWIVGQPTYVGWGLDPDFPNQEGTFFGNIFFLGAHGYDSTKVAAFYCNGVAYDQGTVPGRIGADQVGAPYTDPFLAGGWYAPYTQNGVAPGSGLCADYCTPADYPNNGSGFKACSGWNNTVTTYRRAVTGGTITAAPSPTAVGVTATISKYQEKLDGYCANVNVKNNRTTTVSSWTVSYDVGAATQTKEWFTSANTASGSVQTARGGATILTQIKPGRTHNFGFCAKFKAGKVDPAIKSITAM